MKRKKKRAKVPGMPAVASSKGGDQCVFCFSHGYLYDRGAAELDYENEVEGLIAALRANGYTGMNRISQESLDAALLDHADRYDDANEDEKRRESIIVAALERQWERAQA